MAERNPGLTLKRVAAIGLAAIAMTFLLGSCSKAEPDQVTTPFTAKEGFALPDLTMRTLSGDTIRLSALRGRPVMLNFWASWCKPCREEFPLIERAIQEHNIEVVGVVFQDTDARALAFQMKMGASWPMVTDPSGVIAKGFKVTRPPGIPQTVFIDDRGVYRTKILGQMNEALISETIAEMGD